MIDSARINSIEREFDADSPVCPTVFIPGGSFTMGSNRHYPEEAPEHRVTVDAFWIDRTPVTNRQFRAFVRDTGYVTVAEHDPDPDCYPGAPLHMLKAGSSVFSVPDDAVRSSPVTWWSFRFGASWRHPLGPGSSLRGLFDHPVVHVAYEDAQAYAAWAGKDLPTEAEWEFAARGGLDGAAFAWGEEFMPDGRPMANTWHGVFPTENTMPDGYRVTSPVGSFPPNGYGLSDMIGNVWEWTLDFYAVRHVVDSSKPCCTPRNPRNTNASDSLDPGQPDIRIPRRVLKGGSHLCAPNYCQRYRPAARHPQSIDTSASHIGFRCVKR